MNLIISLQLFITKLFLLPSFLLWVGKDWIKYILHKGWTIFDKWGLHLYVGRFGAGKTSSMVYDAYCLARRYDNLTIVTNLKLQNFPATTKILPLRTPKDILNAPKNTLVLIDEIGTIFNSRDFAKSKDAIPKLLFQHLCQCRHRHMMIFGTTQRWNFLDKQLRDIGATVRVASMAFGHPFARMATVRMYDAVEYDRAFENPLLPLSPLAGWAYVQTDKVRALYDTMEMVDTLLNAEYIPDEEILQNQGYDTKMAEVGKDGRRAMRRNSKVV